MQITKALLPALLAVSFTGTALLALPTPFVASALAQHDMAQHDAAMTDTVTVGPLTITGFWTRATPPGAPTAGGYLTVTNGGSEADRLIAVSTPSAGRGEVHEMSVVNNQMTMRQVEGGIEIPAGGSVTLKPGGFHLMFIDLKEPIVEGTTVPVTVTFAKAGTVELNLPAMPIGSQGPAGAEAGSGHDQMEGMH